VPVGERLPPLPLSCTTENHGCRWWQQIICVDYNMQRRKRMQFRFHRHVRSRFAIIGATWNVLKSQLRLLQSITKLEKCAVARWRCSASRPIPIAKVKTLTRGLKLGFDLWPFDLSVGACQGPVTDYMSTDFGADSWNRIPFRSRTNRQTDRQTDATKHPTPRQRYGAIWRCSRVRL